MTFKDLEDTINKWMLVEDKGIIRLLCATVIANRIKKFKPTWLFIVSNSSGGKSELLNALCYAQDLWEQDDLSTKALISGGKNHEKPTSLLHRIKPGSIMVIKDLTLLLDKDPRESGQIFSQLRLIYDGKLYKSFGTGEDIKVKIRMGLIAGTTMAIEDTQARQASMGMRTIKYYMKQPERLEVTRLTLKNDDDEDNEDGNQMQDEMGHVFKEYLDNFQIPDQIPNLADDVLEDIAQLAEMSTNARSSIKRKEFSRDNPIERKDLKEMPIRMAKQLKNIGRALQLMNGGGLSGVDKHILYQLALDSIPSTRREIMEWATRNKGVTSDGLAMSMKIDSSSVSLHLNDLVALDIMIKEVSYGSKLIYTLREDYRQLMEKFQGIAPTNQIMGAEEEPLPPTPEELASIPF